MKGERNWEHNTRDRLLSHIRSYPGITFKRLSVDLGINEGTLRYHLDVMVRDEAIDIEKDGNRIKYFPGGERHRSRIDPSAEMTLNQQRVLDIIKNSPGITRSEIFSQIGITKKGLDHILRGFKNKKMVWEVQDGHGVGYECMTKDRIIDEMLLDLVEMFLGGKIDEEKFMELRTRLLKKRS